MFEYTTLSRIIEKYFVKLFKTAHNVVMDLAGVILFKYETGLEVNDYHGAIQEMTNDGLVA